MSTYDNLFRNFGRSPVPDDLCTDSAPRHPRSWRRRLLKGFTIYGHGGHLGQWTATILAIFHSADLRRLNMKFEQHWLSGFRGEVLWNSQKFSYSNVRGSYKCIGKQTWPCRKKVKCQRTTIFLATLVDLSSPMIWAKIQLQGILGSGEEDFLKVVTIYGHGGHLGQRTATILAIFCFPTLRWRHTKLEHNWLRGFREEIVWNSQQFSHSNLWGSYKCIGKRTWPCRKKVKCQRTTIFFSNFGRPPVPDDSCKDSASRRSRFWRRRFLKVFTIYGHGGHLGQRTASILAIFCFPTLRWLHMKFEQNWLRGFRGEVVWNSQKFSHSNVWGSYKCIGKRTWLCRKKVKCQHTTIFFATLVDLLSPMICAQIQPQGILSSWEENF